jgi:molybdopterin molybdotransferase
MVPSGADAVVMQENCDLAGDTVSVKVSAASGEHVDPAGQDVKEGTTVFRPGDRLHARRIGMLAALGYAEVKVAKRPRVAILATGSELVEVDETPDAGKIRNSNSYSLFALAAEAGAEPTMLGIADDDKEDLADKIDLAKDYDVLLISAGMSVGDKDLVRDVLKEMGFKLGFYQVAVKPGRPLLYGSLGSLVVFGLPGNPVSSMVAFDLFVRPALAKMQGAGDGQLRVMWAELTESFKQQPGRRQFVRGIVSSDSGKNAVALAGRQGSAILTSMAAANCLMIVPEDATELPAGSKVRVALLDGVA